MSQYVLERKDYFYSLYADPIGMNEYMIFQNRADGKRFVLIKFISHTPETILRATFELIQFTRSQREIRKAEYTVDPFPIEPYQEAVVAQKIEIDAACDSIKLRLLVAESAKSRWEKRAWKPKETVTSIPTSKVIYRPIERPKRHRIFPIYVTLIIAILFVIIAGELYRYLN